MRHTKYGKHIIIESVLTATTVAGMSGGAAVAASLDDSTAPDTQQDQKSESQDLGRHKADFRATIYVTNNDGTTPVTVDSKSTTVAEVLENSGVNVSDYRSVDGQKIDDQRTLTNGENMVVFQAETSEASTETVSIPAPEATKESADLYVGQTKIESEGKEGQAIKTTVTTKDAPTAKGQSQQASGSTSTKESLSIISAPQPKVTLVGTKQPPAANEANTKDETQNQETTASPASSITKETASNTTSHVSLPSNLADGAKAAEIAKAQVGKPYVWGSDGPGSFDCSGLIYYAFHHQLGYNIPRTASEIGHASTPISKSELQVGDILYTETHIGIYVGDGKVVHAATEGTGVVYDSINGYFSSFQAGRLTR